MAKHISKKDGGGIIIFDETDLCGGIVPQGSFIGQSIKQTNYTGMAASTATDPFRNIGILQAGMSPINFTGATTLLTGPIIAAVFDTANNSSLLYGIDTGGGDGSGISAKFHQINFGIDTITNAGAFPHTITGTDTIGQDMIIYNHNSGGATTQVYSAFYSYYNDANWDIGALVNMTGTPNDDFMSTVPANPLDITSGDGNSVYQRTFPHSMCVGSDGILYIGSERYIHAYDGATGSDGTFQSKVLTLPAGIQIQGMIKYSDSLYIAVNYAPSSISSGTLPVGGTSAIYIWNYLDELVTQIIPVNEPYVSSIFIWRGNPCVTAYGPIEKNGYIKVKAITGNQVQTVVDLPSAVNPVFRGIDSRQNTLYLNIGGKIVTIGNRFTGTGFDINYLGYATFQNVSGWIYNNQVSSAIPSILISSAETINYAFSKLSGGWTQSFARTQMYEPDFPSLKYGKIKYITVYFFDEVIQAGSNTAFSLNLITESIAATPIINASQSLTSPLIKKYLYYASGSNLPSFINLGFLFVWNGGGSTTTGSHKISKVIVDYDLLEYQ